MCQLDFYKKQFDISWNVATCQSSRDNVSVLISGNLPKRGQKLLEKSVITLYIQTLSDSMGDTIYI